MAIFDSARDDVSRVALALSLRQRDDVARSVCANIIAARCTTVTDGRSTMAVWRAHDGGRVVSGRILLLLSLNNV